MINRDGVHYPPQPTVRPATRDTDECSPEDGALVCALLNKYGATMPLDRAALESAKSTITAPPVVIAEAVWQCAISLITRIEDTLVVVCSAHGPVGRVPRVTHMNTAKKQEAVDALFQRHREEVIADVAQVDSDVREAVEKAEDDQSARRQRENLDALIASASRAVGVALAEAEDLYSPDHETAEALRAAQKLVTLSKRWNVGP